MNERNDYPGIKYKYVLLFILFTYLIASFLALNRNVPSDEDQYGFFLKLYPTIHAIITLGIYYFLRLFSKAYVWQVIVLYVVFFLCLFNIYVGYIAHYDI